METWFDVEVRGIMGPDVGDVKEISILSRRLRYWWVESSMRLILSTEIWWWGILGSMPVPDIGLRMVIVRTKRRKAGRGYFFPSSRWPGKWLAPLVDLGRSPRRWRVVAQ
eukprot:12401053-Karenia_brevis.AAC.1